MARKMVAWMLFVLGIVVVAQSPKVPKMSVGLDMLTFAWVNANEQGGVSSATGLNLLLGVTHRSYFEPLYAGKGSGYWEVGTIVLVDPFVGAGYDYRPNDMIYFGGGIRIFPLHLFLLSDYPGYNLLYTVSPTIHVGFYLY